jgi:hypothetical protein
LFLQQYIGYVISSIGSHAARLAYGSHNCLWTILAHQIQKFPDLPGQHTVGFG